MCGRFDFHGDTADITNLIDVLGEVDASAVHYNLAPTQVAMAAHTHALDGTKKLGPMRFGMPAPYRNGLVLNARAETAQHKPMFRTALEQRRCLVFANGFYEWTKVGTRKQPYYFTVQSMPVFAFAAVYTIGQDKAPHFAILTTEANEVVAPLHHRMPVILPKAGLASWLGRDTPKEAIAQALVPYTHSPMHVHPVSPQVNSPKCTSAACIAPVAL